MANGSDYAGTDSLGPYIDTGNASAPTARTNVEIDIHTLLGTTEPDSGRADKALKILAPRRPSGQLR